MNRGRRLLVVDAVLDRDSAGGIGLALVGGEGIAAETVLAGFGGIVFANALAVTRGLSDLADMANATAGSVVLTNNMHVANVINGVDPPVGTLGLEQPIDYARQLMFQCGLKVAWEGRREVFEPARKMATIALEIFQKAKREEATWAVPTEVTQLSPALLSAVPDFPPTDPPPLAA